MRTTTFPNTAVARRPTSQTEGQLSANLTKTIPFDYVFEFKLSGKASNNVQDVVKLQDVVEISMQGVFVATSLGYSFVLDERKTPLGFAAPLDPVTSPQVPIIVPIVPAGAVSIGGVVIAGMPNAEMTIVRLNDTTSDKGVLPTGSGGPINFIDAGRQLKPGVETDLIRTGQDGMIAVQFSIPPPADGIFRVWDRRNNYFSQPVEASTIVVGPDPVTKRLPAAGDNRVNIYGGNGSASLFLVEGSTGNRITVEDPPGGTSSFTLVTDTALGPQIGRKEINLNRQLAPGDVLVVRRDTPITGSQSIFTIPNPHLSSVPLRAIATGMAGTNIGFRSGFRLSQRAANIFASDPPIGEISPDILAKAFEPACGAEGVSFLYSIDVVSTGRELQNKPIHNIAGLGIANGDRPFRPFARPIAFEPRSVIRIQIEELSTLPGTLYIVLQGYKTLGTGRRPD